MSFDKRNRLDEENFSYRITKDNKVFIYWQSKEITVLSGKASEKVIAKLQLADLRETQLILAKATGNFKHGNEKDNSSQNVK